MSTLKMSRPYFKGSTVRCDFPKRNYRYNIDLTAIASLENHRLTKYREQHLYY